MIGTILSALIVGLIVGFFISKWIFDILQRPYCSIPTSNVRSGPCSKVTSPSLNAPAIDHIFLFSKLSEVEELARESGLVIADQCVTPYTGKSIEECEAERLPVNVAYVMRKQ